MSSGEPRRTRAARPRQAGRGFTLIELVVVMAILGLLLTMALPRYMASLERGKEQVLAHNLAQMRDAIDRYYGDRGQYPDRLEDLVERRYLRAVPLNPFTAAADWQIVSPPSGQAGRVFDVTARNAPAEADGAAAATESGAAAEPAASSSAP